MRLRGLAPKRVQADRAVFAVEGAVVQGVQAFAVVLLAADGAAFGLVGEVAEHEPRLDEAPVLLQRTGGAEACRRRSVGARRAGSR
ncbi:MAG: hypothetical protein QOK16_2795 [Solirubrobacteraceae bacterium]|nr:hypothetical protein [Solirubrobacteraceae bacterium]MEA2187784.1 hypothetical protein [Solirubrobacteraceae bacterium]